MFTPEQRRFVLRLARQAMTAAVKEGRLLSLPEVNEAFQPITFEERLGLLVDRE